MGSGNRRMKFNTRERVVSNDHNRSQAMAARQIAEMARWMMAATMDDGLGSSVGSTTTDPLSGVVLNGLWARPEIGTVNLFIEPGMLGVVNPDASPADDDSPFKLIWSDGEQTAGNLTLTAGSGSTRIDVIEVSRSADQIASTESRDIYNTSTGTFTSSVLTKVLEDQLTFRIRTGTAGAGFPGTASGWMPLAVVSVPSTATTWNDCIVWDVRPLVGDRVLGPAAVTPTFGKPRRSWWTLYGSYIQGVVENEYAGRLAGGEIGSSLSGLTAGKLDISGSDVVEPGYAPAANSLVHLYAVFPHGLPRWAKYSDYASGYRKPLPFRGIPVWSTTTPTLATGAPGSALTLPTALGFNAATTSAGVLLAASAVDPTSLLTPAVCGGDGFTKMMVSYGAYEGIRLTPTGAADTATYTLTAGTHFPVGATVLRLRVRTAWTTGTLSTNYQVSRYIQVKIGASVLYSLGPGYMTIPLTGTGSNEFTEDIEIPVPALDAFPTGSAVTIAVDYNVALAGMTPTYSFRYANITGWRLGM